MKSILAGLLFCHVLVGINSLSPFEKLNAVDLAELKNERKRVDERNSLFDDVEFGGEDNDPNHGSASGSGGGDDKDAERAIKSVVDVLRDSVVPALVKATKVKKDKDEEYTETIMQMIKNGERNRHVKLAFGKNVLEAHEHCGRLMYHAFVSAIQEGVFHRLKEAVDNEDIDLVQLIYQVIEEVVKSDEGIKEIIGEILKPMDDDDDDNGLHPATKAVVLMKKLLLRAACGNPAEGLAKAAMKTFFQDFGDPDSDFGKLINKIIPFLRKPRACRAGLIKQGVPSDPPKQKFLRLIFRAKEPCLDVPVVKRTITATLKGEDVMKNISILQGVNYKREHAMIGKVVQLMKHGQERYAFELVGKQSLASFRETLLIGLAVNKRMKMQRPRPPSPPGKDYDAPFPATLLNDFEK